MRQKGPLLPITCTPSMRLQSNWWHFKHGSYLSPTVKNTSMGFSWLSLWDEMVIGLGEIMCWNCNRPHSTAHRIVVFSYLFFLFLLFFFKRPTCWLECVTFVPLQLAHLSMLVFGNFFQNVSKSWWILNCVTLYTAAFEYKTHARHISSLQCCHE